MKILHLLTGNEAAPHAEKLILSLHAAQLEQCVLTPPDAAPPAALAKTGIRIVRPRFSPPFLPLQNFLTRRALAREKPDIVHCWTRRGVKLMGASEKPAVVGWLGAFDTPAAFTNHVHWVGASPDIVKHLMKNGVAPDHAKVIPTFPDIAAQPPIDRATLATPREAKILLAPSRLHPHKGLDTLLTALQDLPQCVAWLEGEGPLRRELEALAKKLGVIDRVRFLGVRADPAALLRAADLCVLPARREILGAAILEAWAAGTPVVACANAATAALIEDGVTGLLSPPNDAPALAAAVRRALDDENLRRRLVAQGYAAYIKSYTREAVTRQWIEFYKFLLI